MDFDFSDDQHQLRDAVQRWVDKGYGFERRRQTVRAGGYSPEAWRELADLGLTALAVPEAHGGMGWGAVEAMIVMEELGRGLVLEPVAAAALVAPTLLSAAPEAVQATWLPRIAAGNALVVLAHQERAGRYRLDHAQTAATPSGSGSSSGSDSGADWQLTGTKSLVPVGDQAQAFVVSARLPDGGLGLFLAERSASGVTTRGYVQQDGARAAELNLNATPATLLCGADHALAVLEHAADVGIAAQAAEAVGVMDFLVTLTADYLKTRKQFGVAIASFQALRHRLADCKMQLELARSMSYLATLRLGDAPELRRRAVSQAKVQLGQSMRFVGQQCIQLHGGIGVTDEYVGSHYFKRLTCMEMQWGDSLHHLGEVSARMQETAGVFA